MKKLTITILTIALLFSFAPNVNAANSITNRLKGRLLLQVQQGGAIWYVNPVDLQKYQVTWDTAMPLFESFALGITNADLIKIPADVNSIRPNLDTDGDGYTDREELQNNYSPYIPGAYQGKFSIDNNLANRLKGRLLLQVQQGGAIWYVDVDGTRHNVRWDNLMYLFRSLALGISDGDLAEAGEWKIYTNNQYGYEVKYPSNWSVYDDSSACENNPNKEKTYNPIKIQSFTRPYECEGHSGFGGSGVLINVFVDEKHSTINQWIENIKKVDDSMQINIVKDIVIGGMSGKELTMSCDCLVGSDFDRLIEKNGKVYEFSVASPDVNLNDYLSIIDQILSTFKFLD